MILLTVSHVIIVSFELEPRENISNDEIESRDSPTARRGHLTSAARASVPCVCARVWRWPPAD